MRYRNSQHYATLTTTQNCVVLRSSYDPTFITYLKGTVPPSARRFDATSKTWTIAPQYAVAVADLCEKYLGVRPSVPVFTTSVSKNVTKLIELRYLGAPKDRGDNEPNAFGFVDGDWNAIFPLSVLKSWFADDSPNMPSATETLYAVLGIKQDSTADELNTAYRRAARQWHPDVCQEPDASEQFRRIRAAWDVLSDTTKRAKYNAGLALEASLRSGELPHVYSENNWRPPLRCGYLVVEGTESIGRLNVTKIMEWQDITRADGAVLVTSWPAGAKIFTETWSVL